jgi:acyl-CoA dehydrogenase
LDYRGATDREKLDFFVDNNIRELMQQASSKFDLSYWRQIDLTRHFPHDYWDSLAKAGLFGIIIEKRWQGMERGNLDLFLAVRETAERFSGIASYLYLSGALVSRIFSLYGTEEQKALLLPKLARGELKISIALSEESSGFDASSIESKAMRMQSGKYSLSGTKAFVTNVDLADYLIIFARTSQPDPPARKSMGVSMFLVEANNPLIKRRKLERLGMNFVNSFAIEYQDLIVEESSLIGEVGRGWYDIVEIFNLDRILTAASLLGTGRLALKQASNWAKNRTAFGRPIGSNQGVQFPLADAAAQLEVAEAISLKAASLADQGKRFSNEAAYGLLSSHNAASTATDRALQTFGGHGYYKDYDVERFWRDVRAHKVHPISEELLLASIAERSLGLPKSY